MCLMLYALYNTYGTLAYMLCTKAYRAIYIKLCACTKAYGAIYLNLCAIAYGVYILSLVL